MITVAPLDTVVKGDADGVVAKREFVEIATEDDEAAGWLDIRISVDEAEAPLEAPGMTTGGGPCPFEDVDIPDGPGMPGTTVDVESLLVISCI
jgi:hypothetical protein